MSLSAWSCTAVALAADGSPAATLGIRSAGKRAGHVRRRRNLRAKSAVLRCDHLPDLRRDFVIAKGSAPTVE